jgi:AraC-like DNA-binding protein
MHNNAFRYLPPAPGAETWGVVVTGGGFCKSLAHSRYPPDRHPADHTFTWEQGRVLPVFQILGLLEGSGELESNTQPPQRLVQDSAFLIKPGQWHRFRPNPKTGWTEIWIEFQGLVPNALSGTGQLGEGMVVKIGAGTAGLWGAMDAVLQRVYSALPGVDPNLAALALEALATWKHLCQPNRPSADVNQALSAAVQILNQKYCGTVDLEALARNVGMSYSVFRRTFRKFTGFAPWEYVQHMRLANARHCLATSEASLTELADKLGFSSPFHLSTAFRKKYGTSPTHWKRTVKQTNTS